MIARLAVGCVLCLTLSCSAETTQATEVLLEIDAEPAIRKAISSLKVQVRGGAAQDELPATLRDDRPAVQEPHFPLRLGLVPLHGDASRTYDVTATAYGSDDRILAQARIVSGYIPGSLRFARLLLEDACLGVLQCASADVALTCTQGACISARLPPRDLSGDVANPASPTGSAVVVDEPAVGNADGSAPGEGSDEAGTPEAAAAIGLEDGAIVRGSGDAAAPYRDAGSDAGRAIEVDASALQACVLDKSRLPCLLGP